MSRVSDKKGHKCPRPGCVGFCATRKVIHAGRETRRRRVCRICGAFGWTTEINRAGWEFPLFADAGPCKKRRVKISMTIEINATAESR
jgi:hypothetical protein